MPQRKADWIPKENRTTLKCKDCKKELPPDQFVSEGRAPSGLRRFSARCKICYQEHAKQNWSRARRIQENSEYVASLKTRCVQCGYDTCAHALDFHHTDGTQKEHEISDLVYSGSSLEKIKTEIDKCVVLCANCHRELHAGNGWKKTTISSQT